MSKGHGSQLEGVLNSQNRNLNHKVNNDGTRL